MPSYLVHFNRLHDKRGRFAIGDGDGDGRRNDKISKAGVDNRRGQSHNAETREARDKRQHSEDSAAGILNSKTNGSYRKTNGLSQFTRGDGKNTKSNTTPDGKRNIDTRTGDIKTRDQDRYAKSPHQSGSKIPLTRTTDTSRGNIETGNRLASNPKASSSGSNSGSSRMGPVTPRTPGVGNGGSGGNRGSWNGNATGSNYSGTSRGGSLAMPPSNSGTASSELSDEFTDMLKKDETKDNIKKRYEAAVEKGKDFVDKVFGGKETSTNAKSSDKYRKSDNAGKHGYDKRK